MKMPAPLAGAMPLFQRKLLLTCRNLVPAGGELKRIPFALPELKFSMITLSRCSENPLAKLMPTRPVPAPLMARPRTFTTMVPGVAVALSLMFIPLVPDDRMEPNVPLQSRVIDLVMVTEPKPPGSRQLISPPAAVFEIAPAKVLHGAVRLHGLTSSPTPDIQVRVACACAEPTPNMGIAARARAASSSERLIDGLLCLPLACQTRGLPGGSSGWTCIQSGESYPPWCIGPKTSPASTKRPCVFLLCALSISKRFIVSKK